MYREGSASLRNYSSLTMQVRTLAIQLVLASGLSLALATAKKPPVFSGVMLWGGICLGVFSLALMCVNWHFATAFTSIRNSMADLEPGTSGPWNAHREVRGGWRDPLAYSAPFAALIFLATIAAMMGLHGMGKPYCSAWYRLGAAVSLAAIVGGIGARLTHDRPDDEK